MMLTVAAAGLLLGSGSCAMKMWRRWERNGEFAVQHWAASEMYNGIHGVAIARIKQLKKIERLVEIYDEKSLSIVRSEFDLEDDEFIDITIHKDLFLSEIRIGIKWFDYRASWSLAQREKYLSVRRYPWWIDPLPINPPVNPPGWERRGE